SIELTASSIAFSRWSAIGLLTGRPLFYLTGLTFSPRRGGRKREAEQGDIFGTARFHDAFVQDDLAHRRGAEVGLPERGKYIRHAAGRLLDPTDGDVGRERARLAGKAELGHRRVGRVGHGPEGGCPVVDAHPQDARPALVGERAHAARAQIEALAPLEHDAHPVADRVHYLGVGPAEELERDVEALGRRP